MYSTNKQKADPILEFINYYYHYYKVIASSIKLETHNEFLFEKCLENVASNELRLMLTGFCDTIIMIIIINLGDAQQT